MDESEADVEIDIHQPVTGDECDTKSDYFGVIHPKEWPCPPYTIIILSPQLWLLWIKSYTFCVQ